MGSRLSDDQLRRFLFEDAPVRGHWVRLNRAWHEAREHQSLPPAALSLLGQALAATSLLSASVKFSGTLTLQLVGSQGEVSMLVAQATDARTLRGVVHLAEPASPESADVPRAVPEFAQQVRGGRLVVSVEQGDGVVPWQGIVPLLGQTLAACLEDYFASSEQLPTTIVLAADQSCAAGLLLQKLPASGALGEMEAAGVQDVWEEVSALLATLQPDELLNWGVDELLAKLFGGRDLRLFEPETMRFACRCSRERVAAMLKGMGQGEVESVIAEQGAVTVTCEFCQQPYRFDAVDAAGLFLSSSAQTMGQLN